MFTTTDVNADMESVKAALISRLGRDQTSNVNTLTHTTALYLLTIYEVAVSYTHLTLPTTSIV